MKFYCTPELLHLSTQYRKRDEHKQCLADLCDLFKGKSFHDISCLPQLIVNNGYKLIKSRIKNRSMNKGKSGGYRTYFYVSDEEENIYIFGFYPKTGKHGRTDLTDTEMKILVRRFAETKKAGGLIELDVEKDFAIKEPEVEVTVKVSMMKHSTTEQ